MVRTLLVAALLLPLVALPVGQAQGTPAAGDWREVLTDPVDAQVVLADEQPVPAQRFHGAELRSLEVQETEPGFTFRLDLEDPPSPRQDTVEDAASLRIRFHHGAIHYSVVFDYTKLLETGPSAALTRLDPDDTYEREVTSLDVDFEEATWTFTAAVERRHLVDENAVPPLAGRALEGLYVTADAWRVINSCTNGECTTTVRVRDRMPDDGTAEPLVATFEGDQGRTARLASPVPMRASNGEASTFIFHLTAQNGGDQADRYTLDADGVPDGWTVAFPLRVLHLDPGEVRDAPVLVTVPFAHEHGVQETFQVTLSAAPDDVARTTLGVDYLAVPQPAGHHDTLTIHSAERPVDELGTLVGSPEVQGYMNTLAIDPQSTDARIPGAGGAIISTYNGETYGTGYFWEIPLQPGLRMGLDFDTGREGEYGWTIEPGFPIVEGRVIATLLHEGSNGSTELFRHDALVPGVTTDEVEVAGAFQVPEEADLLPFDEEAGLSLRVTLWTKTSTLLAADDPPKLVPGGTLRLPLLEYRDPVQEVLDQGIRLDAATPQAAAPTGGLARFIVEVSSDQARTVDLSAHGAPAQVHPSRVALVPGETQSVEVLLTVPETARDGDRVDAVLDAVDVDGEASGLVRLSILVDDEATGDAPRDEQVETPALAPLPAGILVALAALVRRRR